MRQNLIAARNDKGYSVDKMADECGISVDEYLCVEAGANLTLIVAARIAKVLDRRDILDLFECSTIE